MPGFVQFGHELYVEALHEEFALRMARLEPDAAASSDAAARDSLQGQIKVLRTEFEQRLRSADYSFF